jgi:HipA N-terminal domain
MRNLYVYIEIDGTEKLVGNIIGNGPEDACFQYAEQFLDSDHARPISISLPLQPEKFSPQKTKIFFEGLLPEGFSRRAVANWIHTDENDYLTILACLGQECIGAIKILSEEETSVISEYEQLSPEQVKALAAEGAVKSTRLLIESHLSLTGASGKVGLFYNKENGRWYLPKGEAPSTHIVKQSHVRLEQIVVNEQLCLMAARNLGIDVANSFIINAGNARDEDVMLATERYDRTLFSERIISGMKCPFRLHQEDFAQALGIFASEKYEKDHAGYLKKMFEVLRKYSSDPIADQLKLWDMIIFNYFIGNTDCHIKNFSLLYDRYLGGIRLAPAYDILSTRVYQLTKEMSFSIGGVYAIDEITRESFQAAAKEVGFGERMALERFDKLAAKLEEALTKAAGELNRMGFPYAEDIKNRIWANVPCRK